MTANALPRLTEEQQKTGLFQFETEYGPGTEKPVVGSLRETDVLPLMWLWPGRIPMEKVTFLVGPADSGKSLLAADLAARVSRGDAWPDDPNQTQEGGEVLYVCDSHEMTTAVAPRLTAAGADPDMVQTFSVTLSTQPSDSRPRRRGITLPDDFEHLVYAVEKQPLVKLVILDSLSEFCPDAARERETMRLLHLLAGDNGAAIVVLARSHGRFACDPLQAVNDRQSAAARCVWSVAEDAEDAGLRQFLPARFSYGPRPGGLAYRIDDGRIAWGPARLPARRRRSRIVEEVMHWLEDLLRGQVLPSKLIQQEARECGYPASALRSARLELGVQIGKEGCRDGSYWCWSLGVCEKIESGGALPKKGGQAPRDQVNFSEILESRSEPVPFFGQSQPGGLPN